MPAPNAFGTGILVDVQQRLNCALPSFLSEPRFLSIPRS